VQCRQRRVRADIELEIAQPSTMTLGGMQRQRQGQGQGGGKGGGGEGGGATALTLRNVAEAHDIDIQRALCDASGRVIRATAVQHRMVDHTACRVVAPQINATTVVAGMTTRTRTTTGRDDDNGGRHCRPDWHDNDKVGPARGWHPGPQGRIIDA
jgi:hypothetical protein